MVSGSELELTEFRKAVLRSEKVRTTCMAVVFGTFALLGVFRILVPLMGNELLGPVVLGWAAVYLAFEITMLWLVRKEIHADGTLSPVLARSQLILECLFPLGLMFVLMLLMPEFTYTLLVSPGYAFMILLIGVSVLRVDRLATLLTGLVCLFGYLGLVAWALNRQALGPSPHPVAMYFTLSLVLALATGATFFVAGQVQTYVAAAVRELQTRREHDRLKRDLEIAGEIQQGLLPPSMPQLDQYDFAAVCRPADQTGGDYFDWQEIGPSRVVFSLGDVTGHGVGPALVTAACRAYVRSTMSDEISVMAALGRVNGLLNEDIPDEKFVTLVLIDLDVETHRFRLLSAGHGPTLVVAAHDGDIQDVGAQGLPLGLADEQMLDDPIDQPLEPGDLVIAVSDGFFEWANTSGELFGIERLQEVIRTHRHESATDILAAMERTVRQFVGDIPQQDDMTGLVIKRLGK